MSQFPGEYRAVIPCQEVYEYRPNGSFLLINDPSDVLAGLQRTRDQILDAFPTEHVPGLPPETEESIAAFYREKGWSVPPVAIIDPERDLTTLRKILSDAAYRSPSTEHFLLGAGTEPGSPGAIVPLDFVCMYDWRERYRAVVAEGIRNWGASISVDSLEAVVAKKVADFAIHELGHLAGAALIETVIEKTDSGWVVTDRHTPKQGFEDGVAYATRNDDGEYYSGTAMLEGWAARQSSEFRVEQDGCVNRDYLLTRTRYHVRGEVVLEDGTCFVEVIELHSGIAGMIFDELSARVPAFEAAFRDYTDGEINAAAFNQQIRSVLPERTRKLLNTPSYSAWQKLYKEYVSIDS